MSTSGHRDGGGGSGSASMAEIANLVGGEVHGDPSRIVSGVSHDSQSVTGGDLFAAIPGRKRHGAEFVRLAINAGASAVWTDELGQEICAAECADLGVSLIVANDIRKQLGAVCLRIYGQPPVKLIGITGTNGKTTTAYMVMQGAKSVGMKTGMIGTLATYVGDTEFPAIRTTPEAPEIFRLLHQMSMENVDVVVMEVSSIAISEYRIGGLKFDVVGFTNLSHDHLDYHGTMDNYFEAKALLFSQLYAKRGVTCINDSWGQRLLTQADIPMQSVFVGASLPKLTEEPDWWGVPQKLGDLVINDPHDNVVRTQVVSPGDMNAMNATLAIALLDNIGLEPSLTCAGVGASVVPGRGQLVCTHNDISIYVDYAHSPDAIESFLSGLVHREQGKVITVIGAGGDRDTSKRPLMGAEAARHSQIVIVTDDNPRSENPADIRNSVVQGVADFPSVYVENIEGRRNGIKRALELAQPGDQIAILGKGHESGIEIAGEVIPFNDSAVVLELVNRV